MERATSDGCLIFISSRMATSLLEMDCNFNHIPYLRSRLVFQSEKQCNGNGSSPEYWNSHASSIASHETSDGGAVHQPVQPGYHKLSIATLETYGSKRNSDVSTE